MYNHVHFFQHWVYWVTFSAAQRLTSVILTCLTLLSVKLLSTCRLFYGHKFPQETVHSRFWWFASGLSRRGQAELVWLQPPRDLTTHHLLRSSDCLGWDLSQVADWLVCHTLRSSRSLRTDNDAHSLLLSVRINHGGQKCALTSRESSHSFAMNLRGSAAV